MTTYGYLAEDVGWQKVLARADAIGRLDPTIQINAVQDRYRAKLDVGQAIFLLCRLDHGPCCHLANSGQSQRFLADDKNISAVFIYAADLPFSSLPLQINIF